MMARRWWSTAAAFACRHSMTSHSISSTRLLSSNGASPTTAHLTDDEIMKETSDWVDRIVVGLSLCPFSPRSRDIRLAVVRGSVEEDVFAAVLEECIFLQEATSGTALVIAPECAPNDFETYLQYYEALAEDLLLEERLERDIQIAPFHPLFQFGGEEADATSNWTSKPPHPVFHVLRQAEVTSAVTRLDGDGSKVWQRNINLLQALSNTLPEGELQSVIRNESDMTKHESAIANVLKEHPVFTACDVSSETDGDLSKD